MIVCQARHMPGALLQKIFPGRIKQYLYNGERDTHLCLPQLLMLFAKAGKAPAPENGFSGRVPQLPLQINGVLLPAPFRSSVP